MLIGLQDISKLNCFYIIYYIICKGLLFLLAFKVLNECWSIRSAAKEWVTAVVR